MTTPDWPQPTSYVLRVNPDYPTWAMQVTSQRGLPVRIPLPLGVTQVSLSWDGASGIDVALSGRKIVSLPPGVGRRMIIFEVPTDTEGTSLQFSAVGSPTTDVGAPRAGVRLVPLPPA